MKMRKTERRREKQGGFDGLMHLCIERQWKFSLMRGRDR
jgi:hypothetical protein